MGRVITRTENRGASGARDDAVEVGGVPLPIGAPSRLFTHLLSSRLVCRRGERTWKSLNAERETRQASGLAV